MKLMGIAFAAAALLLIGTWPDDAEAHKRKRSHGSVGIYSPGISFYLGPYERYRYYPYYFPRYPRNPFYGYRTHIYSRPSGCGYWSDRCAANWGDGGPDYYGCMRYHGC